MNKITLRECPPAYLHPTFIVAVFQLLKPLVEALQPLLVPLCFLSAWALIFITAWSVWTAIRDTAVRTREMHQIPCANCQFFTSNYHLKCTVHPSRALTEAAIDCPDYEPTGLVYRPKDEQPS
ncbi:hypothetical protein [Leptodesmis sichuanensis]|uniref:hypothetical protein n=1 Tax=Leptodesmis sichuanensis TaxID=2906798 RepID=UPI001F364622|nr:hypothetical protein [Leptodesmis sichuanensis]